ncbi:MAG: hypothetical protein CMO82_08045 [Winogradskyella sp.]|uniref:DUF4304 domain-containing protein n=1 Tax=Winogradskyella poriferorum TaxID=307627 RepID=A0ABU7WBG8_9FLAO|nr:hypothetical protein [Winogradskyella sp.]|tara:strand:+ start:103 stop:771 length:669 start_codon:yes stop_codon:yes gene_type:complete
MTNKIDYKKTLDEIQKLVHLELKADGFKKKGRTHNKTLENGLIQVVNFQMAKYEFDSVVEIPGIRTNLYGNFAVNIGVFVPELYESTFNQKPKAFIQEYDCEIRERINDKASGKEYWFSLGADYPKTAEFIIRKLKSDVKNWFDRFDERRKIVSELTESNEIMFSPREKLCGAIIELEIDRENGERIFNEYYNSVEEGKPHKNYVKQLAKQLNIKLTEKTST